MESNQHIVIFSGYNQRAVIAFLRTLQKNGIPYSIIALPSNDSIRLSAYCDHIHSVRRQKKLDIQDICRCLREVKIKSRAKQLWIVPSTEALNRFLLKYRAILEERSCIIPLVCEELYCKISDKHSFGALCQAHDILIPPESNSISDFSVPFVAKPYKYCNSTGEVFSPQIIMTEGERDAFCQQYSLKDFYYQKYVNGESDYLLYYFHRDGNVSKFSQKNIVQQPDGKSILAALPHNLHHEPLSLQYERMFCSFNFYGLVMVEIRKQKEKAYMIEANPRLWGPSQLFVDANMNLFESMLFDWGGLHWKPSFQNPKYARYYWSGGFQYAEVVSKKNVFYDENQFISADYEPYNIYNRADTYQIYKEEQK